jgi:hypothetical protein
VPGPGTYEISAGEGLSKAVIPRSGRKPVKREGPGPGDYNVQASKKPSKLSIHAGRFEEVGNFMDIPTARNPAPDSYQKLESVGLKGKSIPRKGRGEDWSSPNPGPGKYEVTHGSFIKKSYNVDFPRKMLE